jgi:hypothetical protein
MKKKPRITRINTNDKGRRGMRRVRIIHNPATCSTLDHVEVAHDGGIHKCIHVDLTFAKKSINKLFLNEISMILSINWFDLILPP